MGAADELDRLAMALTHLVGGPDQVRRLLADQRVRVLRAELAERAAADVAEAVAAAGPHRAARWLLDHVAARPAQVPSGYQRGRYAPAPVGDQLAAIVELRAAGTSVPAIAEKVGRPVTTVRNTIARYELRTGRSVTPDRVLGRDGKSRPARHGVGPPGHIAGADGGRDLAEVSGSLDTCDAPTAATVDDAAHGRQELQPA